MSKDQLSAGFSGRLKALKKTTDPTQFREELHALARMDVNFLQAIQLNRLIDAETLSLKVVKVSLLSSTTCDHLIAGLRVAGLRYNVLIKVWCGQYGQYQQEIMTPSPELVAFDPDIVIFSHHAEHMSRGTTLHDSAEQVANTLNHNVAELAHLWKSAAQLLNATVIQQTCIDTSHSLFGNYDRQVAASPFALTQQLNNILARHSLEHGVGLIDLARQVGRDGLAHWFDEARWLQAKMQIAPHATMDYGELVVRHIAAQRGQSRKCLVMDLDNTLWGGIVGDDGVDGLILGEGSGAGEAHLNVQRYALALKERGIILAVCSKNEIDNAKAPFLNHPDMLLKLEDIAAFVANWNDKASNLRDIARQLNIGLDSLVFLDDNPAERERVRDALPMVAVPELPDDPAGYAATLANQGYFEAVAFTSDDKNRADQYAANAQRQAMESTAVSMADYLSGLNMKMSCGPIETVDLTRCAQLFGKTNQFNTTTRRYSKDRVEQFSADDSGLTLQARLSDKFGDNGLVTALLFTPAKDQEDTQVLLNWVMSCRVFGRQLEFELMNIAVQLLQSRGVKSVVAEYIPTPKNGVIKTLFADLGFKPDASVNGDDPQQWILTLAEYKPTETQIAVLESS